MPSLGFIVPATAGSYQLSPVPQASQAVRVNSYRLTSAGDTGASHLSALVALAANPALHLIVPVRLNGTAPAGGDGAYPLPPGSPLVWHLGTGNSVYGSVDYSVDGPSLPSTAAWSPLNLPGLGSWLGVSGSQWSDNRVTAANALDARVYKWAAGLRSFDGVAADTGANRLYRTAEGGVRGDGVAAGFRAFSCLTGGDFTCLVKLRRTSAAAGGFFGPAWSVNARFRSDGAGSYTYFDDAVGGGEVSVLSGTGTNTWYTLALKKEAGVIYLRGSGGNWITYGSAGNSLAQVLSGINFSQAGELMTTATQIAEAVFLFRAITDQEWTTLNTYWGT